MTIDEFIAANNLRMRVSPADRNPNMDDEDSRYPRSHWRCTISAPDNKRMVVTFSQGSAFGNKEPELPDVLDCLASDAATIANARDFNDWCADLGYDSDSRKAERTYNACERQAKALQRLLSVDAYKVLLWDIERL